LSVESRGGIGYSTSSEQPDSDVPRSPQGHSQALR